MSKTWYPVIDYDKCTGCLTCYDKCKHGVYELADGKPVVVLPAGCVQNCHGCGNICPEHAIEYVGDTAKAPVGNDCGCDGNCSGGGGEGCCDE
jgi:NAD-dependent dihydropyrimidine dehydrogenase PreA subunit